MNRRDHTKHFYVSDSQVGIPRITLLRAGRSILVASRSLETGDKQALEL